MPNDLRTAGLAVGDTLPVFERTTGFPEWNRYAAVNDEFIDVHMSSDAARAAGQPDVFGMGNLKVAYVHAALSDWLGARGDVSRFSCQFRVLNFRGDTLSTHMTVTGVADLDGLTLVDLAIGVTNQRGEETMPGTAQVVLFGADGARMPAAPDRPVIPERAPGVYLDDATIAWLGKPLPPLSSLPIDANDIRRWNQAACHPAAPPPAAFDVDAAREGSPWGELVAARDFNPFAWNPEHHPEAYPWMRGMGTEPGYRGLNGGSTVWYFAPMRVGDVVTADVTLVDAFEKEGKVGPMMFLVDETRLTNQRGELVRISNRVSIYS
jgi:acyl dehydratase